MSELLPSEIWTEILVRLPARSLLTLKCVSKSFLSFIQNPIFAHSHLSRFNNSNEYDLLLLEDATDSTIRVFRGESLELEIEKHVKDDVVGCVDGIFWLFRHHHVKGSILYNPSIRQSILIPPYPGAATRVDPYQTGFGYDPLSHDYKAVVLTVPTLTLPRLILVHVYSLRRGCWRSLWTEFVPRRFGLFKTNVYADGAIHWMTRGYHVNHDWLLKNRPDYTHIVSFDLGTETFSVRSLPEFSEETIKIPLSFSQSLAVVYISEFQVCVWVAAQDGWTEECVMPSGSEFYGFLRNVDPQNAIFSEKDDQLLIATKGDGLVSYDFKTQQHRCVQTRVTRVEIYVENLLSRELMPSSAKPGLGEIM